MPSAIYAKIKFTTVDRDLSEYILYRMYVPFDDPDCDNIALMAMDTLQVWVIRGENYVLDRHEFEGDGIALYFEKVTK